MKLAIQRALGALTVVAGGILYLGCAPSERSLRERLEAYDETPLVSTYGASALHRARLLLDSSGTHRSERDDLLEQVESLLDEAQATAAQHGRRAQAAKEEAEAQRTKARARVEAERRRIFHNSVEEADGESDEGLPAAISTAKYVALRDEHRSLVVDLRSKAAYLKAHLPEAISIPRVGLHTHRFPTDRVLVFLGSKEDVRTVTALEPLRAHSMRWLTGDAKTWEQAGLRVQWAQDVRGAAVAPPLSATVAELKRWSDSGRAYAALDVRGEHLYSGGHLAGAISLPLPRLRQLKRLPQGVGDALRAGGTVVVIGASNSSSIDAAHRLRELWGRPGDVDIRWLEGGIREWALAGERLERGTMTTAQSRLRGRTAGRAGGGQ